MLRHREFVEKTGFDILRKGENSRKGEVNFERSVRPPFALCVCGREGLCGNTTTHMVWGFLRVFLTLFVLLFYFKGHAILDVDTFSLSHRIIEFVFLFKGRRGSRVKILF